MSLGGELAGACCDGVKPGPVEVLCVLTRHAGTTSLPGLPSSSRLTFNDTPFHS